MEKISIKDLAYFIKECDKKPIFFLGAGVSKSGGIPLADEIAQQILKQFPDHPKVQNLSKNKQTYSELMGCLLPNQRNSLLKGYIDEAKINVSHIYLAQLFVKGYAEFVLTVNFDNLMLRALALYNVFPATYDMAIFKKLTTEAFKPQSVVYLHGQSHGQWLLNTEEEMNSVKDTIPRIIGSIVDERPLIFVGYSGNDPIFEHIKSLGRFSHGLYWVTYKDHDPIKAVQTFLDRPDNNASMIKGYDSDAFFLKLNTALGLDQPKLLSTPFTALSELLDEIVDIDDDEHFKSVKERLKDAKRDVKSAIQQFEKGELELLKKEVIQLIISEKYDEQTISVIANRAKDKNDSSLNAILSSLYCNWGNDLGIQAQTKQDKEADALYEQAFEKYQKATGLKPDYHEAFYNWGTNLGNQAQTKQGTEADALYKQACEKYQKATEIKPDKDEAFYNWGNSLSNQAQTKQGTEADALYEQAFEKYQKATKIKPSDYDAFHNWGTVLSNYAKTQQGEKADALCEQAFEKLHIAKENEGNCYNIACLQGWRGEKRNALKYLEQALEKSEISVNFIDKDDDWDSLRKDEDFEKVLNKYRE